MKHEDHNIEIAMRKTALVILILVLFSCNHIETGSTISSHDIEYINSLILLDNGERIYKFYSEYTKKNAGNFFTDRRMAMYWIDHWHKERTRIVFAFYPDIKSIDTVYFAGSTYCPYMLVTKKDNSTFQVCVEGNREQIKSFFEEALKQWELHR